MRHRPTSAGLRPRPRWVVAAAATATVLVASAVSATDETYRSAHGFTVPVPAGCVRIDPARGGLRGRGDVEASFVRPATADGVGLVSLDVTFQPIADWSRRSMAEIASGLDAMARPSAPGMTVERFTRRDDAPTAPDRVEVEWRARMKDGPPEQTLLAGRAGRDGIAWVLLSGPLSADRWMRAEFPALRDGLRFDPELVYRLPDTDEPWGEHLLFLGFVVAVMALVIVLQLRTRRTTSERRPLS
ncbi:MAG: hypothetical protein JNM10_18395 [Planctomycetia bacterium]|nr:hypothetical protein [Planctomycetia bacterium]